MHEKQSGENDKFENGQYIQKFLSISEWCKDKTDPNHTVGQNSFHVALVYAVFYHCNENKECLVIYLPEKSYDHSGNKDVYSHL